MGDQISKKKKSDGLKLQFAEQKSTFSETLYSLEPFTLSSLVSSTDSFVEQLPAYRSSALRILKGTNLSVVNKIGTTPI